MGRRKSFAIFTLNSPACDRLIFPLSFSLTRCHCLWLQKSCYCVSVTCGRCGLSDGHGVVATFFLIRNQSVVARRSEINFARQFFRISFFITAMQQNFSNALTECLWSKIALDSAPVTNGNSTCLFGDNDGDGIRFLGDSEPGGVAQSKAAAQRFP